MKIRGLNLEEKEVEYKPLSEYPFFRDERQDTVKFLEQLYFNLVKESQNNDITRFPQKDGKVIIKPGMLTHSCSNSLESLESIAKHGVLASEWFGEIESELEGVFCTFISRIHDENSFDTDTQRDFARSYNSQRLKSRRHDVTLFFDSTNPVMKKLLHMDYFEYEKIKQLTPEKLAEIYSSEEIELFKTIIEPFSKYGRDFHIKKIVPKCDWSAIPGGIPSALINGICIKDISYDNEYIQKLKEFFPNATIFNGDLEIVHTPEREEQKQTFSERIRVLPEELTPYKQIPKASEEALTKSDETSIPSLEDN